MSELAQGHPYSGDNLHVGKRGRYCRTCRRERQRRKGYWIMDADIEGSKKVWVSTVDEPPTGEGGVT